MIEALSYPFMQRAIIAGILVGFLASYFGVFIVQRRMSFMGSGLAHAAFGGVALGLLLEAEPLIIAVPFTVVISLLITILKEKTKLSSDTSIGILFAVSVALGIIFISLKEGYSVDAFNYLFGSILAVNQTDLWLCIILTLITILSIFFYWKRWSYATFDSELALSDRQNVTKDNYLLSVFISVTIVVSIKLVGIVLIAAFLVIPAASARLLSSTFFKMTIYSIIIGISSSMLGLLISFVIDIPSGATIILVQALLFLISLFLGKTMVAK